MPEINTPPTASGGPQLPPIDPKALVDTAIAVIRNPTEFYRSIKGETGFQKCLIFSVACGVVNGILAFAANLLWVSIHMGVGLAIAAAFGALLGGIISGVLGPFIGGLIVWGISLAFGSKASWEPSIRIAGYSMAVAPFAGLSSFVPYVGWVIALAAWGYGIYICVQGAKVINFDAPPAPTVPPTA